MRFLVGEANLLLQPAERPENQYGDGHGQDRQTGTDKPGHFNGAGHIRQQGRLHRLIPAP